MAWHSLKPTEHSVFNDAPILHRHIVDLPVPPECVWESLISDESIGAWGLGVKVRWTSPRPLTLGATREVVLPGRSMTVRECFFRWDEGAGYSFAVVESNRATFLRFAEDYQIEPTDAGSRFTWTVGLEPGPGLTGRLMKAVDPLTASGYGLVTLAARRYFSKSLKTPAAGGRQ